MSKVSQYNKYLSYKNNDLFLEDISLESVARKFNTPVYCYSISQIEHNYLILKKAFRKLNPMICYALKANFNSKIIKTLSNLGSGIDVVSSGELEKSLSVGIDNKKIVFSGGGKTSREIDVAIKKNIKQINVESEEELKEISESCRKRKF